MVVPLIPVAVIGLLALITLTTGAILLAPYLRDIVTGESTPVELAESDVINNILDDPDLTEEAKIKLILELIKSEEMDWTKDAVKIVFVLAVVYFAMMYFKK